MFNIHEQLQDLRSSITGIVLTLVMSVLGLTWISIGLYSYLTGMLGPIWGPIALGGICFIPGIIFGLIKASNKKDDRSQQYAYANADPMAMNIPKLVESLAGQSPFFVTIVAIVAGFLATRFPSMLLIFSQVITAYVDDVKIRTVKATADKAAADAAAAREHY